MNSICNIFFQYNKQSSVYKKDLYRNKRLTAIALSFVLAGLTGCSVGYRDYANADTVMGTIVSASFSAKDNNAWSKLRQEGSRLENKLLSRRVDSSEISAVNASAGDENGYVLSVELEEYLLLCSEVSKATDGAFDITVGALATLWGIDEAAVNPEYFVLPGEQDIDNALSVCGYEKMTIVDHRVYLPAGMELDLGAVGKGIYLSQAYELFEENVQCGYVAAGGSILTYGYKQNGQPWHIGIADPSGKADVIYTLSLEGSYFVSTSGDYERYVEYEGVKYHHILNPDTGYPSESGISSVTVVIPADKKWDSYFNEAYNELDDTDISGLMSDAITTAVFVLGETDGMEYADSLDVDILLVRNDGSVVMSAGMKKYIE